MSIESSPERRQKSSDRRGESHGGLGLPDSPPITEKLQDALINALTIHQSSKRKPGKHPENESSVLVYADYSDPESSDRKGTKQAPSHKEFTARNFDEALEHSAKTGKPILLVTGNGDLSDFDEYKKNILPELKKRFGDKVVLVVADTATQEGQQLAARNWINDNRPNTMLLSTRRNGAKLDTEHVSGSWFVGTSAQFIPDHIGKHLKTAYGLMETNGFPKRVNIEESDHTTRTSDKKTKGNDQPRDKKDDRKDTFFQIKSKGSEATARPGAKKDHLGRYTNFVSEDGTTIEYRYRSDASKEPDTIVIDGTSAWVPTADRNRWHRFSGKDGQWSLAGYWDGTMGPSSSGEYEFRSQGKETTRWTLRGGVETVHDDGSALELKDKRVVKATRSDGSMIEPVYEAGRVTKYKETRSGSGGKKEEVVWTRLVGQDGSNHTIWESSAGGERRLNLRLTDREELKFETTDGKQHSETRDCFHLVFDPTTKSTIKTDKRGDTVAIQFGDGTLREYAWKNPKGGARELVALTVTTPEKKVYKWEAVAKDRWKCNGSAPYHLRPGLSVNNEYSFTDLDKDIRVERDLTGAVVKLAKSNGQAVVFHRNEAGEPIRIEESSSGSTITWMRSGAHFVSGDIERPAKLVINPEDGQFEFVQSDGLRYIHRPGQPEETRGTASDLKALARNKLSSTESSSLISLIDKFDAFVKAEGVPVRRAAAIYNRLSDKLDSADASALAQALREIRRDLRPRPLLMERTSNCADAHADNVQAALDEIPQELRARVMRLDYTFVAANSVVDLKPNAANESPRGYPVNSTFLNVAGYHSPDTKTACVAQYTSSQGWATDHTYRVKGITFHEFAHALDNSFALSDGKAFSETDAFIRAYNKDVAAIPESMRAKMGYFIQSDAGSRKGSSAGRQEAFADVLANILGSSAVPADNHLLDTYFPNLKRLIELKIPEVKSKRKRA